MRAPVLLSGASTTRAPSPHLCAPATTVDNPGTCRAFFEAWNKRDMQAAVNLFSEDVVYEDVVTMMWCVADVVCC